MRDALYGKLVADRQGKLWAEIGAQAYTDPSGSFPPIQQIDKRDWMNVPSIEEIGYEPLSLLECGGVQYAGAASGTFGAYLSNAPSTTPYFRGTTDNIPGLAITGQNQLNQICGNIYANRNAKFPRIELDMSGNLAQFDIAPQETVDMNMKPILGNINFLVTSYTHDTVSTR